MCDCCSKEAQRPNFSPELAAILPLCFANIFLRVFDAQQLQQNRSAFGVSFKINETHMRITHFGIIWSCPYVIRPEGPLKWRKSFCS